MSRIPIILLVLAMLASLAIADDTATKTEKATKPDSVKIGVVDINRLFKKNAALSKTIADLKQEGDSVQAKIQAEADALAKEAENLKAMPPSGHVYNGLASELVRKREAIQAEIDAKRKEFIQRETRLYYDGYQQIKSDVAKLAKSRHLTIVLNVNSDEMSPNKPDDVVRGISKSVVWYDDAINLTPLLEKNYASSNSFSTADKQDTAKREGSGGQRGQPKP